MDTALPELTIKEAARLIQRKSISPVDLARASLERIEKLNPVLHAYITVIADGAMEAAKKAEEEVLRGNYRGPLHGIPVSFKDNIYTKGVLTTAGSKVLADSVPEYDATVVTRLKAAGALMIGKCSTWEFADGAYGVGFPNPLNPWGLDHMVGGSSSGSGVAIAASMDLGSIGSDTGGSVRMPASLCGVVGLKGTYGLVSKYGLIPLGWSTDVCGPLAKTVEDVALMLQAIAGHDPQDPASARVEIPDYAASLKTDLRGLVVGVPQQWFADDLLDPEVESAVRSAIAVLRENGCIIREISIPSVNLTGAPRGGGGEIGAYHLHWLRTRPQDYSPTARRRYLSAVFASATDYVEGQRFRRILSQQFYEVLESVDIVVTPTVNTTAPKYADVAMGKPQGQDHIAPWLARLQGPFSQAGLPAISVPCGFSRIGLPIGLQIGGRLFDEATVLQVAHAYEQATDWHRKRPPIEGVGTKASPAPKVQTMADRQVSSGPAGVPTPAARREPLTPQDLRALAKYWGIPATDEDLEIIARDMAQNLRRRAQGVEVDLGDTVPAFISPLEPQKPRRKDQ